MSIQSDLAGSFITYEGIDGCGKTTQLQLTAEWLTRQGYSLCQTREPGGTVIGQKLRALLLDPQHTAFTPQSELLLYLADRLQHLQELIVPAQLQGQIVLCDRFHDATLAYQGFGRGLDFSSLETFVSAWIRPHFPQLTLWFDVPVEIALERISARQKIQGNWDESRFDQESRAFFERVSSGYRQLAEQEPKRIQRIDATGTIEVIQESVQAAVRHRWPHLC